MLTLPPLDGVPHRGIPLVKMPVTNCRRKTLTQLRTPVRRKWIRPGARWWPAAVTRGGGGAAGDVERQVVVVRCGVSLLNEHL